MKTIAILNDNNFVENIEIILDEDFEYFNQIKKIIDITNYKNNVSIGEKYEDDGYFYTEKPYESWTQNKGEWVPPKEKPENFVNIQWRGTSEDDVFLSPEEYESLSFNSAGRPKEFVWSWNEEILDWEKNYFRENPISHSDLVENDINLWKSVDAKWAIPIENNQEFAGRFTSDTYAE